MARKAMFTIFQEEAIYWQDYFQLSEWKAYFTYKPLKDCWADIRFYWKGMSAIIRLSKSWKGKTEYEVRRCAFHEICHMLLSDMANFNYHQDAEEIGHRTIRKLENSIFEQRIRSDFPELTDIKQRG